MKFGELKSVGHNIADSLASGIGLMIGVYEMDVFGEAGASPDGVLEVDFLNGKILEGNPSPTLTDAVMRYSVALPELCERHGADVSDFRRLTAKYSGTGLSRGFSVTVENRNGKSSTDRFEGVPGARPKVLDSLGRIRRT